MQPCSARNGCVWNDRQAKCLVRWLEPGGSAGKEDVGVLKGRRCPFLLDLSEQRCWFCAVKWLKSSGPSLNNWWPVRALFFTFLITHVPWWPGQLQITAVFQADMQGRSRLSSQEPWASCPESSLGPERYWTPFSFEFGLCPAPLFSAKSQLWNQPL